MLDDEILSVDISMKETMVMKALDNRPTARKIFNFCWTAFGHFQDKAHNTTVLMDMAEPVGQKQKRRGKAF